MVLPKIVQHWNSLVKTDVFKWKVETSLDWGIKWKVVISLAVRDGKL